MRSMMWLNIQFEIFIFLMFGFFVWLHRVKGRATLHETPYVKKEVLTFADQERWPDLEDESLTPSDARLASSLDDAALQPASDLNPYLPRRRLELRQHKQLRSQQAAFFRNSRNRTIFAGA